MDDKYIPEFDHDDEGEDDSDLHYETTLPGYAAWHHRMYGGDDD